MNQKNLLTQAVGFLQKRRQHRWWLRTVTSLAAVVVFATTYLLILPAITMEHSTLEVTATPSEAVLGEIINAEVCAEAEEGRTETFFALSADGDNAGLDESQIEFDEEGIVAIEDADGQVIDLHREYSEDGLVCYWFTLTEGQSTRFILSWVNGVDRYRTEVIEENVSAETEAELVLDQQGDTEQEGVLTISFGSGATLDDAQEVSGTLNLSWQKETDTLALFADGTVDSAVSSLAVNNMEQLAAPEGGKSFSEAANCTYSLKVETAENSYGNGQTGIVNTSSFTVVLDASFSTGWAEANGNTKVYYYQLPQGISLASQSGELTDASGNRFGSYEFTTDGYIVVTLSNEAVEDYYNVSLNVRGTAEAKVTQNTDFTFDRGPTITVTNDGGDENLSSHTKSVETTENPDGSITYDYLLAITAKDQSLTNLEIEDVLTCRDLSVDDLTLSQGYRALLGDNTANLKTGQFGSNSITVTNGNGKSATLTGQVETAEGTSTLHFQLSELPAGETLKIAYQVTVAADARLEVDANSGSFALSNTVRFSCQNNGESTNLGSNSTYTPYQSTERWLTKTDGETTTQGGTKYIPWTLQAGNRNYTMNGLYLTDTIILPAYEAGVKYATNQPTQVVVHNETTNAMETIQLTWEQVDSLDSLSDAQKANRTKIYYHENEFIWYSGTKENNQAPYTYTLTYYTTYVEEIFAQAGRVNGAAAHYKSYVYSVEPEVTMAEVSLTKALQELSDDGVASYVSEIYTNGQYEVDHFLLTDYLPVTVENSAKDGDQLTNLAALTAYAEENAVLYYGQVDSFKALVAQGENCLRVDDTDNKYILLFDSVQELEELSGIRVSVTGKDGSALNTDEMLAKDNRKILLAFTPDPVTYDENLGYLFDLQFNVDIDAMTQDGMIKGLPGTSSLPEYKQGYTIRLEYATTAHRWGDKSYAGQKFINQQEMNFRVPRISSADQTQKASAYYFFDAVSDSTILNKYIAASTESEDGKVKLDYSITFDLSKIDGNYDTLLLLDGISSLEGVDWFSVETAINFMKSGASLTFSGDNVESKTYTGNEIGGLGSSGVISYFTRTQIQGSGFADLIDPYEPLYALRFESAGLQWMKTQGYSRITVSYPLTVNQKEINLTEGDYNLRNAVRLYGATSAGGQEAISESWADYGYTADVLGKFQLQRPSANNDHTASWQIVVNPDKLKVNDPTSFTMRDELSSSQILNPASIRVYGVHGVERTELTENVTTIYDPDTNVFAVTVTGVNNSGYDRYIIEYETNFRGAPGSTVEYSNTAEIVGMTDSEKTVTDRAYLEESSGSASGDTAAIQVYKYDANATSTRLQGAKFTLYALVDPVSTEAETQEAFLKANESNWVRVADGTTGQDGTVTWAYSNEGGNNPLRYITPGRLFKLEETAPPAGYLAAEPVYGYINDGSKVPGYFKLFSPFTTGHTDSTYTASVYVPNTLQTALEIRKVDPSGKPLSGAQFSLYRDEDCTDLVRTGTELSGGIHRFGNLEPGTYYLKETQAPAGYRVLDITLTVTVSSEGEIKLESTASESGDWSIDKDSSGWYITITNYSGYTLPETGGIGTTLFTTGGLVLMALAVLMYKILRRKRCGTS